MDPELLHKAMDGALHVQHSSEVTDSTAAAAKIKALIISRLCKYGFF